MQRLPPALKTIAKATMVVIRIHARQSELRFIGLMFVEIPEVIASTTKWMNHEQRMDIVTASAAAMPLHSIVVVHESMHQIIGLSEHWRDDLDFAATDTLRCASI